MKRQVRVPRARATGKLLAYKGRPKHPELREPVCASRNSTPAKVLPRQTHKLRHAHNHEHHHRPYSLAALQTTPIVTPAQHGPDCCQNSGPDTPANCRTQVPHPLRGGVRAVTDLILFKGLQLYSLHNSHMPELAPWQHPHSVAQAEAAHNVAP